MLCKTNQSLLDQISPGWSCREDPMLWPSIGTETFLRHSKNYWRPHSQNWHGHSEGWFFTSTFCCMLEGGVWGRNREGICKRAIINIYLLFHNSMEQHKINLALRKSFMQNPAELSFSQQYWRSNSGLKNSCLSEDKDQIYLIFILWNIITDSGWLH